MAISKIKGCRMRDLFYSMSNHSTDCAYLFTSYAIFKYTFCFNNDSVSFVDYLVSLLKDERMLFEHVNTCLTTIQPL